MLMFFFVNFYFRFLFDSNCSDYKYYEYRLLKEQKALAEAKGIQMDTSELIHTYF